MTDSELHQASEPMLHDLSSGPVVAKRRTGLEGASLLEQSLLGMDRNRPPTTAAHTLATLLFYANELIVDVTGWSGDRVPPVSGLLAAVQTAGFVALLVFSLSSSEESA